MQIGYARVSKADGSQVHDLQRDALVAAGVGVAIVPEGVARGNPDVAVRAIDVDVTRQVGLAYPSAHPPSDALKEFIASLPRQANSRRVRSAIKKVKRA